MRILGPRSLGLAAALALGACQWGAPQPGIDKLSVAPDFTFANTRTVALDLKASAEVLGKSGWASVQIARPDGKLLYQGPIGVGHPLTARIALASKDAAVNATLITEDGARHDARIAVSNNSAQHNF